MQVGEIMTGEPLTVLPEDTMEEIVDVLLATKVGGLPVVNLDNVPVGMVSYLDVLTAIRNVLT
jgi:CBS domain-containing protein